MLIVKLKADVLVDIECDSKHLDHVVRMLKREVQSVNYATTLSEDGTWFYHIPKKINEFLIRHFFN